MSKKDNLYATDPVRVTKTMNHEIEFDTSQDGFQAILGALKKGRLDRDATFTRTIFRRGEKLRYGQRRQSWTQEFFVPKGAKLYAFDDDLKYFLIEGAKFTDKKGRWSDGNMTVKAHTYDFRVTLNPLDGSAIGGSAQPGTRQFIPSYQ